MSDDKKKKKLLPTEFVDDNTGVYIGISVMFSCYSILILILAVWATSTIPSACKNETLRSSLRGLMVTSVMSLVSFIAYGICRYTCRQVGMGPGGVVKVKDRQVSIPDWLYGITFVLTIINLVFQGQVQTEIDSAYCNSSSSGTIKRFNSFCMIVSGIVLAIISVIGGVKIYNSNYFARKQKEKESTEAHKGLTILTEDDINKMSSTSDDVDEKMNTV